MKRDLLYWGLLTLICLAGLFNHYSDRRQDRRIIDLQDRCYNLERQLYGHICDTTAFHQHPDPTKEFESDGDTLVITGPNHLQPDTTYEVVWVVSDSIHLIRFPNEILQLAVMRRNIWNPVMQLPPIRIEAKL